MLVTGAGSVSTNTAGFIIGNNSPGNRVTTADGGEVYSSANCSMGVGAAADNNSVLITGSNSVWRLASASLYITGDGNNVMFSTGGVAVVTGIETVSVGANNYVSNSVSEVSSGFDLDSTCTLTLNGTMHIQFAGAPTELGPHWGLRWNGNHTNALQGLTNSGALTISDGPALPARWQDKASIYYDTTNTYVGFHVSEIFGPPKGMINKIR